MLRNKLKTHAPDYNWDNRLLFAEHHQSYAASAFYPSPFESAAILTMDNVVDVKEDGSFRLDLSYFDYCAGLRMTNESFDALFEAPPRSPESQLTQREMDLAASIQDVTEEIVLRLGRSIAKETGKKTYVWPVASHLTASQTTNCCATRASTISGYSPRPVTPVAPLLPIMISRDSRASSMVSWMA